jgi:hypothetical protein
MKSENSRYSANCTAFERCSNRPETGASTMPCSTVPSRLLAGCSIRLQSPTELEKTIRGVAKELDDADQQGGA